MNNLGFTIHPVRDLSEIAKGGKISVGTVLPTFIKWVLLTALALAGTYAVSIGLDRQDLVTCHKLKSYSQTHVGFYATNAETKLCGGLGIAINTPLKAN